MYTHALAIKSSDANKNHVQLLAIIIISDIWIADPHEDPSIRVEY